MMLNLWQEGDKKEMRIQNQEIVETDKHLMIELQEPFWGAWKKYSWTKGIEGFGLSRDLILASIDKRKRILISFKYGKYEITGTKAKKYVIKYKSFFKARNNVLLCVVPRFACKKIGEEEKTVILKGDKNG